jgi:hypothetical protein
VVAVKVQESIRMTPASFATSRMRWGSRALAGSPAGVERARARKPGVDEQRLPGGRHDQGGLSPFDVDEVDVERGVDLIDVDPLRGRRQRLSR